jgi:two-component system, OmpR family, phosphate regulon sensor histidine kinase PhoR
MLNRILKNISSAQKYIPAILISSVVLLLSAILFIPFSILSPVIFITLIAFFDLAIIYMIGDFRRTEIEKISSIINRIRNDSLSSESEIELGKYLSGLENEIKEMYLKSRSDIAHLKKLEQVRTEFLANVSHELRTPIFAIQGFIETLLDGAIDDKNVNKTFLEKANHHTINLNNLLNDLIDISMIESGQMKMSFRFFNIFDFLDSIDNELKIHAMSKNLSLVLEPFDKSLQLYGDKPRLKQVMTNLIINAIKYTETGSVTVGVVPQSGFAQIYVRDTGLGIQPEDQDRIFERFYRIDKDRSREMGGTGLGLAIVKHIVEAHDSKITVQSEPGKGSIFSFRLKK